MNVGIGIKAKASNCVRVHVGYLTAPHTLIHTVRQEPMP